MWSPSRTTISLLWWSPILFLLLYVRRLGRRLQSRRQSRRRRRLRRGQPIHFSPERSNFARARFLAPRKGDLAGLPLLWLGLCMCFHVRGDDLHSREARSTALSESEAVKDVHRSTIFDCVVVGKSKAFFVRRCPKIDKPTLKKRSPLLFLFCSLNLFLVTSKKEEKEEEFNCHGHQTKGLVGTSTFVLCAITNN